MMYRRKIIAILLITLFIIPLFDKLIINRNESNLNPIPINKLIESNKINNTLSSNQLSVQTGPILSKIFPLVFKTFIRTELYTELKN